MDLDELLERSATKAKPAAPAPKGDNLDDLLSRGETKPAREPSFTIPQHTRLGGDARPAPAPDRVAPGGLRGLITGAPAGPERSTTEALARGGLQGASYGFGDEVSAAVDTGLSKFGRGVNRVLRGVGLEGDFNAGLDRLGDAGGGQGGGLPLSSDAGYQERRDAYRRRNAEAQASHPGAYLAGEVGGSLVAPGGAAKGTGLAGRTATFGAQGALAGAGHSEAEDLVGVAKDAATSGAASAVLGNVLHRVVGAAPERVDRRILANISRGEAGGAARDSLSRKVVAKAGDDATELNEVLGRHPTLKKVLAGSAASNPARAEKLSTKVINKLDDELTPTYQKIDKGPAVPKSDDVQRNLNLLRAELKDAGNTGMADVVERFQGHITKHFAEGAKVTASQLRRLKGEIGEAAQLGQADPSFATRAKRLIYGALNQTIEDAAANTPGVSVARLRELNRDTSMLIAVRDTLADRATKAASGRTSLFQNLTSAGLTGGGFAAGGVEGLLAGAAVDAGRRAALPLVRATDFQMARLVRAARAGSTSAQLGQLALELGLSRAAAQEIARRGVGALQAGAPEEPEAGGPVD
jgi:hypothetical protein